MSIDASFSEPTIDPQARLADPLAAKPSTDARASAFWGDDGLRFGDVLDALNPLQHIPIVSTVYRTLTGDEISPGARVAGGTLFGGPLGLISSLFNAAVDSATGRDMSEHLFAMLPGGDDFIAADGAVAVASEPTDKLAQQASLATSGAPPVATAIPAQAEASAAQTKTANMAALAALQRDLLAPRQNAETTGAAVGDDALAALRRDVVAGATTVDEKRDAPAAGNLFAFVPPPQGGEGGPTRADGRKPGEYSAAELASIYRAYQRAAEAAASDNRPLTRVEE